MNTYAVNLYLCQLLAIAILASQTCDCIRFFLHPFTKRCFKQPIYSDELMSGQYEVFNQPGTQVDLTITDIQGHTPLTREKVEGHGKFAVTSDAADNYELCFIHSSLTDGTAAPVEVYVDYYTGVEAKKYGTALDNAMPDIEMYLMKVEDMSNAIINDFAHLKHRNSEMNDTTESTNRRLFYQTVTSVIILVALGTWQVIYMRAFFKSRKLID